MAKLVFGLNQSLNSYVDPRKIGSDSALFRHFVDHVRDIAGCVNNRRTYEFMQYRGETAPEWGTVKPADVAVWRRQPTWVVSRSYRSAGLHATLVQNDIATVLRELTGGPVKEIVVAATDRARSQTGLGFIDDYRPYVEPRRTWRERAALRRAVASAPRSQRPRRRRRDPVDVCYGLVALPAHWAR